MGFSAYTFPNPEKADKDGLLAMGGDLSPQRLLAAYYAGVFPWFDEHQPVLWWSPDPRFVLYPRRLHISKSMKQLIRKKAFRVTFNLHFKQVIENCAAIRRPGQSGTWITPEMIKAYLLLQQLGYIRSAEVWQNDRLVGGLYGVYLKDKHIFCGESMFSKVSNASKYGFIALVEKLQEENLKLVDCQVYTSHLESLGAEEIPRKTFLEYLR